MPPQKGIFRCVNILRQGTRSGLTLTLNRGISWITTGSQQALDLIGKVFLNQGDGVVIEEPGYLGAIQSFSLCEPVFLPVTLEEDGLNLEELENALQHKNVKLVYTVPNFQNPTGLTYSLEKRNAICELLSSYDVALIEDDPYGELRFRGESLPYIGAGRLENSILHGTFSKTVSPGMHGLGFIITRNKELMKHLVTAKQGTDLHTNIFAQYAIHEYLMHNAYEDHIKTIKALYKEQAEAMISAMKDYFPPHASLHGTGRRDVYLGNPEERPISAGTRSGSDGAKGRVCAR